MQLTRRTLLLGGLATAGGSLLNACSTQTSSAGGSLKLPPQSSLAAKPGQNVVTKVLTAKPTMVDLGGRTVATWAYDDALPGPLVRATAGDLVRITLKNDLPAKSSIHWHGIALRNAADGVPGLTQEPVGAGQSFTYEFIAPTPGTYFYHPHVGVQLDRGLYAPIIIEDPAEPGAYDHEWILVLDDWIDGTGKTPDDVIAGLISAGANHTGMGGMDMDSESSGSGTGMSGTDGMDGMSTADSPFGDAGDVAYPHYLINGRISASPETLRAKPGQRVRLRIINAAADTIFAVALGGHRLTVTHSDGYAVQPTEAGAFYIGMGERYDVLTTLRDGVFPLVAKPIGKTGQALAVVRTSSGASPHQSVHLRELAGPTLLGADLEPAESSRLPTQAADQRVDLKLTGQMGPYTWAINGDPYPKNAPIRLEEGKRVKVRLVNATMMAHPMHIHGHTFALPNGLRKDTVLLKPMQNLDVELQADNPGNWMAHCHNIYHAEAGMMAVLTYP